MTDGPDDDERASWTIRNARVADRKAALEAADKRDVPLGVWIGPAIQDRVAFEENERWILPSDRAPVVIPPAPRLPPRPQIAPPELAGMLKAVTKDLARAAALGLPKRLVRHAYALLEHDLRAARGLEPLPPPRPRATRVVPPTHQLIDSTRDETRVQAAD